MRFAAVGRTHWLVDTIRAASSAGHEVALIVTADAAPEYRAGVAEFEQLAAELGAPLLIAAGPLDGEPAAALEAAGAEIVLSVNWPTLIPARVRDVVPRGFINAHSGVLPRYRGNACPNWAILAGEPEITVSLHQMVDELDGGAVFLRRSVPVTDSTYITDVYDFLDQAVPAMFVELLDGLDRGDMEAQPQDDTQRPLRTYPRTPQDSAIGWSGTATDIARLVRASADPFAGAHALLPDGTRLTVWRAHAEAPPFDTLGSPGQVVEIRPDTGEVSVLCGDGFLALELVSTTDDGERRRPSDVIRSTRTRLGSDPAAEVAALRRRLDALERAASNPPPGATPTQEQ